MITSQLTESVVLCGVTWSQTAICPLILSNKLHTFSNLPEVKLQVFFSVELDVRLLDNCPSGLKVVGLLN
jgi:hypothetical protein